MDVADVVVCIMDVADVVVCFMEVADVVCVMEVAHVVVCCRCQESIIPVSAQTHISLDQIPETHSMLKLKRLEEEGESALETVLSFMGSLHISR